MTDELDAPGRTSAVRDEALRKASVAWIAVDGGPAYPVLTGDYTVGARWESVPIEAGRPLATPKPVFRKLDPSIVDEELARLAD